MKPIFAAAAFGLIGSLFALISSLLILLGQLLSMMPGRGLPYAFALFAISTLQSR